MVSASGVWHLASAWDKDPHGNKNRFNMALYGQNPFAWVGSAAAAPAICTTGMPTWEDYTFAVAVRPEMEGAVGALVNVHDRDNALLLRWSAANDRGPRGNRLTLEQIVKGKHRVLAVDRGGFLPAQWYKLTIVSGLDGVRVLIDNRERLAVTDATPRQGAVGLYTESPHGATFDNVTVYGRTLHTDLIFENRNTRIQERFLQDWQGMRSWAAPDDWFTSDEGLTINRHDYFGEQWMVFTMNAPSTDGRLLLLLHGNGADERTGLRALLTADGEHNQEVYQLFHDGTELAKTTGPLLPAHEDVTVRFRYAGQCLSLEVDGKAVLQAADAHRCREQSRLTARTAAIGISAMCWCWAPTSRTRPSPRHRWIGSAWAPGCRQCAGPASRNGLSTVAGVAAMQSSGINNASSGTDPAGLPGL